MTDSIEQRFATLETRVLQLEDELAIRNLVVRYGLAVDCGDDVAAGACHTEDAIYEVAAAESGRGSSSQGNSDLVLKGKSAISDMLQSDLHQSLLPNCAHTVGPCVVKIDGDKASATGYSRLYLKDGESPRLMRLGMNHWQFQRSEGQWLICFRRSTLVGTDEAQQILKRT
jgi:hypothetical protein